MSSNPKIARKIRRFERDLETAKDKPIKIARIIRQMKALKRRIT